MGGYAIVCVGRSGGACAADLAHAKIAEPDETPRPFAENGPVSANAWLQLGERLLGADTACLTGRDWCDDGPSAAPVAAARSTGGSSCIGSRSRLSSLRSRWWVPSGGVPHQGSRPKTPRRR